MCHTWKQNTDGRQSNYRFERSRAASFVDNWGKYTHAKSAHSKPSAEYFSSALARIAIDPSKALFIDDHEANVAAARDCGMHAEVFHVSEGVGRIHEILAELDLGSSDNGAAACRCTTVPA
jgi:beta-phosphoglucomutase-like phosphatase (HAD superfamily)